MSRSRHIARLALLAALAACTSSRGDTVAPGPAPAAEARREIATLLERAAAAWNRGDLDAFMSDYAPGEGTTFVGARGALLRGTDAIRAVYAPRFAPGGVRDSLSFDSLAVDVLCPDVAHVFAHYILARGDSVVARGPTSLVMRRVDGRWRIVHDHSS